MAYMGKEAKKECIYICTGIIDSLCSPPETNTTL